MKKIKTYSFLIPLIIFLFVLQGTKSTAAEPGGLIPEKDMPGMQAGSISEKYDHPKQKMKLPIFMPTLEKMVNIGYKKGDPERGSLVFKNHCVYCHGRKGLGNGPITLGLDAAPPAYFRKDGILYMTDQDVFNIISYGTKTSDKIEMPAWTGILTEEKMLDVIAYIRELASSIRDEMTVKGLYEKYADVPPGGGGRLQLPSR